MKTGIELIAEERQRQIEAEGFDVKSDSGYINSELANAAICYAMPYKSNEVFRYWPWDLGWWKPSPKNRIRELQKAGALIAAEIDRLQSIEEQDK